MTLDQDQIDQEPKSNEIGEMGGRNRRVRARLAENMALADQILKLRRKIGLPANVLDDFIRLEYEKPEEQQKEQQSAHEKKPWRKQCPIPPYGFIVNKFNHSLNIFPSFSKIIHSKTVFMFLFWKF